MGYFFPPKVIGNEFMGKKLIGSHCGLFDFKKVLGNEFKNRKSLKLS